MAIKYSLAYIGDTFHHFGASVQPLLGFQPNKAMVSGPPIILMNWFNATIHPGICGRFPL